MCIVFCWKDVTISTQPHMVIDTWHRSFPLSLLSLYEMSITVCVEMYSRSGTKVAVLFVYRCNIVKGKPLLVNVWAGCGGEGSLLLPHLCFFLPHFLCRTLTVCVRGNEQEVVATKATDTHKQSIHMLWTEWGSYTNTQPNWQLLPLLLKSRVCVCVTTS